MGRGEPGPLHRLPDRYRAERAGKLRRGALRADPRGLPAARRASRPAHGIGREHRRGRALPARRRRRLSQRLHRRGAPPERGMDRGARRLSFHPRQGAADGGRAEAAPARDGLRGAAGRAAPAREPEPGAGPRRGQIPRPHGRGMPLLLRRHPVAGARLVIHDQPRDARAGGDRRFPGADADEADEGSPARRQQRRVRAAHVSRRRHHRLHGHLPAHRGDRLRRALHVRLRLARNHAARPRGSG